MKDWGDRGRIERFLIVAISIHSLVVGAMLLFATDFTIRFAGWKDVDPTFFARQAGVFHIVVAAGYIAEHIRWGGVTLLLVAKTSAVVFLLGTSVTGSVPWVAPFSGALDGLMVVAVLLARASKSHTHRTRSRTGDAVVPPARDVEPDQ